MEQDLQAVLAFCNEVRQGLGREPVRALRRGHREDPQLCVVGATINHGARNLVLVDRIMVTIEDSNPPVERRIADTPPVVGEFIQAFDIGEFPEFEGTGWAE